jgi:hypothetical protein
MFCNSHITGHRKCCLYLHFTKRNLVALCHTDNKACQDCFGRLRLACGGITANILYQFEATSAMNSIMGNTLHQHAVCSCSLCQYCSCSSPLLILPLSPVPPPTADTITPAEQQGCMTYNFTAAEQTAQIFHPSAGCGTSQPVSMTYKGQRCSGGSAASSNRASVLWQSAEPAGDSGLDASKCALQRRTGTAAEDLIFNMDWFGSCGVPPARVQYIARSECPAAPPPPPPSPSPTPEDQKALERGEGARV